MLKKNDSSAVSQSSEPDRNNIKASGNKSRHLDSGQPLGTALGEITEGGRGKDGVELMGFCTFSSHNASRCAYVCVCVCPHTRAPVGKWMKGVDIDH